LTLKLRFSAKYSFFGQSLSRGHYQPTYQPPEGVYLLNIPEMVLVCGNIISDISDHFSQFCIMTSAVNQTKGESRKVRDFSKFRQTLSQLTYPKLIGRNLLRETMSMLIEHSHSFTTNLTKYSINTHPLKLYLKED